MAPVLAQLAGGDPPPNTRAFLEVLRPALASCPDPDRALVNLHALCEAHGSRLTLFSTLIEDPRLRANLLRVLSHSQVFADVLVASPEWLEVLREASPALPTESELLAQARAAFGTMPTKSSRRNGLRRFRKRTLLRIGTADVLGLWSFEEVVRAISLLADTCLRASLELVAAELAPDFGTALDEAGTPVPFAVIALGKLGGQELNYASDVDVLFVCGGDGRTDGPKSVGAFEYFDRLARGLVETMSEPLEEGFLFRTDTRLRPEGRGGPLVRSLQACRTYYDSYGRAWERQALLRARACAGDPPLGEEFVRATRPFVFGKRLDDADLREILRLKAQHEERVRLDPGGDRDLKQGIGGIRDVEYTVQLLQILAGAEHPRVQRASTLEAVTRLREIGALTPAEARDLREGYVFARRAEHAVQIRDQFQTHHLPADEPERRLLARRLGFPSQAEFDRARAHHARRVRRVFEEAIGGAGWTGGTRLSVLQRHLTIAPTGASAAPDAGLAVEELEGLGFREPGRALAVLARLARPESSLDEDPRPALSEVVDELTAQCAGSGDPDAALVGIEALSGIIGGRRRFFELLDESPHITRLLALLAGRSPFLTTWLRRSPELLDGLVDPAVLDEPRGPDHYRAVLARHADGPLEGLVPHLCRLRRRELLRIGLRDIADEAEIHDTSRELEWLSEAILGSALHAALADAGQTAARVGVLAMGSFGGCELHMSSDLDVVLAHDEADPAAAEGLARAVTRLLRAFAETRVEGRMPEVDTRLRPDGQSGALVPSLASVEAYIEERARPWERVAATRGRPVWGDATTAERLAQLYHRLAYGRPMGSEERSEVHDVRERVETARDRTTEQRLDLKLCRGGLLELDLLVRMVQIEAGRVATSVRAPGLREAIRLLARARVLAPALSESLSSAFRLLRGIALRLQIVEEESSGDLDLSDGALTILGRKLPREITEHPLSAEELRARIEGARHLVRTTYERVVESGMEGLG